MTRYAVVFSRYPTDTPQGMRNYLPENYEIIGHTLTHTPDGRWRIGIQGEDVAGWTLDDYVLPRLDSGGYAIEKCRDLDHVRERTQGVMN